MAFGLYQYGTLVHLTGAFRRESDNAPVDPGSVTLTIVSPSGTHMPETVTHDGVGQYSYDLFVDEEGDWEYRFDGTGGISAGGKKKFTVESQF